MLLAGTWHASGTGRAPVVHIVDDDDSLRQRFASLLRSVGLNAMTYRGVFADRLSGRCIVLDIHLSGMSGLDFQEQLASWRW